MKHDVVTMYQMESDTWVFQFYDYVAKDEKTDSKTKNQAIQKFDIEVFNRFEYETNINNTKFIISAIKGMFEYLKYQSALIELLRSYEEKIIIEEHIVTQNNFFTKDQDKVLLDMGNQLRAMLKTELSNRFVKQLYTSLHNRVKFPNMYQNSYKESLESKYSKMRKSKKTTSYSNHFETTVKAYYNYYLQYNWLLEKLDTFDYYMNKEIDGFEFAENDEHVKSWRKNYEFLKSNGIIDLLFQGMEFLATYIEIFSDDEMQPVSLTSQDGRIYEDSVGPFKNLCQSGKIMFTQGKTHEDRSRCRAVC